MFSNKSAIFEGIPCALQTLNVAGKNFFTNRHNLVWKTESEHVYGIYGLTINLQ